MKRITTCEFREAVYYRKRGLTLERVDIRPSTVNPQESMIDFTFTGENAGVIGMDALTEGFLLDSADILSFSGPLADCLLAAAEPAHGGSL
jgi:hypothetical protein